MGHTWTRQATTIWVTASTALLGRLLRLLVALLPAIALGVQQAGMLRLPTTIMTTTADHVSQAAMSSP
jgi:Pyruvate/2-oxoacid:ferredoxin oxidoreductase gamma subunit